MWVCVVCGLCLCVSVVCGCGYGSGVGENLEFTYNTTKRKFFAFEIAYLQPRPNTRSFQTFDPPREKKATTVRDGQFLLMENPRF